MDNDLQELREVMYGILQALAGLTAKVLELEENQKKIGMYEVYTNSKIKEAFDKKEEK
jgi:hypothetical protein